MPIRFQPAAESKLPVDGPPTRTSPLRLVGEPKPRDIELSCRRVRRAPHTSEWDLLILSLHSQGEVRQIYMSSRGATKRAVATKRITQAIETKPNPMTSITIMPFS